MIAHKNYTYMLIENGLFINIEQCPMELFLILNRKAMPFQIFERKTSMRLINCLPGFMVRVLRISQFTFKYYKAKNNPDLKDSLPKITSQHYGECLLKLRFGEFKVFNLKKEKVITVFPDCVPISNIQERLRSLRQVRKVAPKLIEWKIEERYIVEKYINFKRSSYDFYNIRKFNLEVLPLLENIRVLAKPKTIDLQVYICNKINYLESKVSVVVNSCPRVKTDKIISFIAFLKNSLKGLDSRKEDLILSHGDLWEGNILIKGNKFCIIDWDTLDYRSFYFDFFYFMFMLASKDKSFEKVDKEGIDKLVQNLEVYFKSYYEKVKKGYNYNEFPCLKYSTAYRYLFYLEIVYLKLQTENVIMESQINEVTTWIKRFKLYEEIKNC